MVREDVADRPRASACPRTTTRPVAWDSLERTLLGDSPLIPDYGGPCISQRGAGAARTVRRAAVVAARERPTPIRSCSLVLDGLGWEQLEERRHLAPTLCAMEGGPILTVAPSTTATALTSITTGMTPGEHGVVGYRMDVDGEILNVLRWSASRPRCRDVDPAREVQPSAPFLGHRPAGRHPGRVPAFRLHPGPPRRRAVLRATACRRPSSPRPHASCAPNEPFVYAYYDGVDKVAHEYGLGRPLRRRARRRRSAGRVPDRACCRRPRRWWSPPTTARSTSATTWCPCTATCSTHVSYQSGEGRFRWLHARPGHARVLLEAAEDRHQDTGLGREPGADDRRALVRSRRHARGPGPAGRRRPGRTASPWRSSTPTTPGPFDLIARHGSLTPAEMRVPLLVARGAA